MKAVVRNSAGFTLLELLLVVTVLSAVAWMSLGVVTNNSDQIHFEDTRNRMQAIRRAIIGDTSRTVNGGPEVRGYVADMGRLPNSLQELLVQGSQTGHSLDATTGLWHGWNGPYLSSGFSGAGSYLDGWGNDDASANFGWNYSIYADSSGQVHLLVQSLGRDGLSDSGGGGSDTYEADFPSVASPPTATERLISESQYRIKITESGTVAQGDASQGLKVDFGTPASCWGGGDCTDSAYLTKATCNAASETWIPRGGACSDSTYLTKATCIAASETWLWDTPRPEITSNTDCIEVDGDWEPNQLLCMAIIRINNGSLEQITSSGISITWDGTSKAREFIFEDNTGPSYDEDTYLYLGQIAYGVFEYDNTTSTCQTSKPFPAGSVRWKNFTYVPGTTLEPFKRPIFP